LAIGGATGLVLPANRLQKVAGAIMAGYGKEKYEEELRVNGNIVVMN
jgi:hypothetical protein